MSKIHKLLNRRLPLEESIFELKQLKIFLTWCDNIYFELNIYDFF